MQQQRSYMPESNGVMDMRPPAYNRGRTTDWSGEITAPPGMRPALNTGIGGMAEDMPPMQQGSMQRTMPGPQLNMQNNLPDDVIESPMTNAEVYAGSTKAMLRRNLGNYVVATFLVGTQNTVSWEGVLYDVGNDYVTIYQPGRDRYIVNDIYSLKYTEFYDVQRRRLCDRLIEEQGGDMGTSWSLSR